jgi:hypothetical protein
MATERGPKLGQQAAREAIEADAQCSTAWAALGLAQHRLHHRDEAEVSLSRALALDPNDIYAQSAMVALLQDLRQDGKAEALVGLLAHHAGAEDLVASVHDEARRRRLGRIMVERKADPESTPREPRSYFWIWILAAATTVGLLFSLVGPSSLPLALAVAVALLILLHRLLD